MINKIKDSIELLELNIEDPRKGLSKDLFGFINKIVPMVNVDLLIKDKKDNYLLSWRADSCGPGWHIPGRIIRYKETFIEAIYKLLETEIHIDFLNHTPIISKEPIFIYQDITNKESSKLKQREHFISFLFECTIYNYTLNFKYKEFKAGDLCWFNQYPSNFISGQNHYKQFLGLK